MEDLDPETFDFNTLVSDFEDRLILRALTKTGGNKKEAARLLNLKRTTLIEKIKKKQLEGAFSSEHCN
jgi:DNA-binding NtrC family response regulator